MFLNISVVVLGVGAVVVYLKAVRSDKSWGIPVVSLLALGAIVISVLNMAGVGEGRSARAVLVRERYQPIDMLGRQLRGTLNEGDNVLLMTKGRDALEMEHFMEEYKSTIESSARTQVNLFHADVCDEMTALDAAAFNAVIEDYRDKELALIVALDGLPVYDHGDMIYDLEYLSCLEWSNPPLIVSLEFDEPNYDMLRDYIENDYLKAVALRPATDETVVVTRDNLEYLH